MPHEPEAESCPYLSLPLSYPSLGPFFLPCLFPVFPLFWQGREQDPEFELTPFPVGQGLEKGSPVPTLTKERPDLGHTLSPHHVHALSPDPGEGVQDSPPLTPPAETTTLVRGLF